MLLLGCGHQDGPQVEGIGEEAKEPFTGIRTVFKGGGGPQVTLPSESACLHRGRYISPKTLLPATVMWLHLSAHFTGET